MAVADRCRDLLDRVVTAAQEDSGVLHPQPLELGSEGCVAYLGEDALELAT